MLKKSVTNFNLFTIKYPLTAIISLLHRVSGFFVFISIPFLLWLFYRSVNSAAEFDYIKQIILNPLIRATLWLIIVSLSYHLLAGIRHLLMDAGFGESLGQARLSAKLITVATIVLAVLLGLWLC